MSNKLEDLNETLQCLNSNEKQTNPTSKDAFTIMTFAVNGTFDQDLSELMFASSAAYATAVQLRALRSMYSDIHATKPTTDDPLC